MENKHGMPIKLKDKQVIINTIRFRAYDGSYIVPHTDEKNIELFKLQDPFMAIPKKTEWKVIWSGEDDVCSFMSICGKVLSIRSSFATLFLVQRLRLEPWPVADGAGDWKLQVTKTNSNGESFSAKLIPVRWNNLFPGCSVEIGRLYGLSIYVPENYYIQVPSPGWKVEIVESSSVDNNRDHLTQLSITYVYQGPVISDSQVVGGDYYNSGHNKNYSGSQNSGSIDLR